jgi:hypothetical protein
LEKEPRFESAEPEMTAAMAIARRLCQHSNNLGLEAVACRSPSNLQVRRKMR